MSGRRWVVIGLMAGAAVVTVFLATQDGGGESSFSSARQVAEAANCTGYEETDPDFGTTETGTCQLDGEDVQVYLFTNRDQLLTLAQIGCELGSDGEYTAGANWMLTVADERLADQLGGETGDVCT